MDDDALAELLVDDGAAVRVARRAPVVSVAVLWQGTCTRYARIPELVGPSLFKSEGWRDALDAVIRARGLDPAHRDIAGQTDPSGEMEGLYIKEERDGRAPRDPSTTPRATSGSTPAWCSSP